MSLALWLSSAPGESTPSPPRDADGPIRRRQRVVRNSEMATATDLFESPDLYFAELVCPPDDPDWGEDNQVTHPILALPTTPVWQSHDGAERQLVNQNNVVFHSAGSEYRRESFQDLGYRCLFFFPGACLLQEVAAELHAPAAEDAAVSFPPSGPLDSRTFGLSRLAARWLRSGPSDPSAAREVLYEVLRGAVRASGLAKRSAGGASAATMRARRAMVEEAKAVLTSRMGEGISLDDLAAGLYTSPYHLARLFRTATGFSVHGYLIHLRLRTGLDRIQRTPGEIGEVGLALGYKSHSHFTASFRLAFGLTPSEVLTSHLS
jgi:AraC family transcriptional regulator